MKYSIRCGLLLFLICLCVYCGAFAPAGLASKVPKPLPGARFDRAQFMLLNLSRGRDSTGFYLSVSRTKTAQMLQDLDKAVRQLEQVEKTYAKSRGRPDDRFLQEPAERIKLAERTARELHTQLKDAEAELKASVQQILITE